MPGSRFTYATGKLVLWRKDPGWSMQGRGPEARRLRPDRASPTQAAPYGAAAVETMKKLRLYDALQPKFVQGENIAPGLPVRRYRQRRARLRRAVADPRQARAARAGSCRQELLQADPPGRGAAARRARTTRRRRPSSDFLKDRRREAVIQLATATTSERRDVPPPPTCDADRADARSWRRSPRCPAAVWARRWPGGWRARARG